MVHKSKQAFIAILLAVSLLLPTAGYAAEAEPEETIGCAYDDSTLLVKLRHSEISVFSAPRPLYGCEEMEFLFQTSGGSSGQSYGLRKARSVSEGDWYVVRLQEGVTPLEARKALEEDPRVVGTMLNYIVTTFDDPAPSEGDARQWYLQESGIRQARALLEKLGISPGGSEEIVVAVVDTGVDYLHPDLMDNIWINPNETLNGLDDDGNGFVDDIRGWNFGDIQPDMVGKDPGNNDPMDKAGHGTMCAGIIAAADNGFGVTGVAYNVKVMPVRAIGSTGLVSSMISAMEYACKNGADVVNMSIGITVLTPTALTPYENSDVQAMTDMVNTYKDRVVFVSAAGNQDRRVEGLAHGWPNEKVNGIVSYCATYPAALDGVIGVMSYGQTAAANGDWLSNTSRWDPNPGSGPEYEIMAPGDGIYTTALSTLTEIYTTDSGTSFSTPFVSGIAALLLSTYKGSARGTPDQILKRLLETADMRRGYTYGSPETTVYYPCVNIFRALSTQEDLDGDGAITESDWRLLCRASHSMRGTEGFVPAADYNGDSVINVKDQALFMRCFQINQRANEYAEE